MVFSSKQSEFKEDHNCLSFHKDQNNLYSKFVSYRHTLEHNQELYNLICSITSFHYSCLNNKIVAFTLSLLS